MKAIRIIPRLDVKGPNLVKGIHLEGLRVLGKPSEFAQYYYENGADELLFMDVVASLYDRNSLHEIITETTKKIFIPITVGGGLRTISDIREVLRVGADKVCLNTAAIKNPSFIEEASKIFGSSTIVVAIEAIKYNDGNHLAFIDNGREYTGLEVVEWAKRVEQLGAGEIVITSVDHEGTGKGMDIELIRSISNAVKIPVVAHGGVGDRNHVLETIKSCELNGIIISSLFHYDFIKNYETTISNSEGNSIFLSSKKKNSSIEECNINSLKEYLISNGINCRL